MEPYFVLGVESDADFETIRAAYRRLVRENHPDVAPDKDAATARMAQINHAWHLLGDPERRAAFDTHTRLKAFERQNSEPPPTAPVPRGPAPKERNPHPKATKPQVAAKPATARTPHSSSRSKNEARAKAANYYRSPTREAHLTQKISRASQLFHRENRADEAAAMCRSVLLADGRNVAARELLGEIFAQQGRFEHALMMFDQAIQIAPTDRMLRRKRSHLQKTQASLYFTPYMVQEESRPSLWTRLRARLKGTR